MAKTATETALLSWQRLSIRIPPSWNPVRIDGDFARGYLALSDLEKPRLGIRWETPRAPRGSILAWTWRRLRKLPPRAPTPPADLLKAAIRAEVGALASADAKPIGPHALIHHDPDPPGRDVAVVWLPTTGRLVALSYPIQRRDPMLARDLLPTLTEAPADAPTLWSIFELTATTPPDHRLTAQRFTAGDLSLALEAPANPPSRFSPTRRLYLRQVAVAAIALKRQSLTAWMASMGRGDRRTHRRVDTPPSPDLPLPDGRSLPVTLERLVRRRRFVFAWWLPRTLWSAGLHDPDRDRLVLAYGTDRDTLLAAMASVGQPPPTG